MACANAALLLALPLDAQSAPTRGRKPELDSRSAATWFPLAPGHRLVWRTTSKNGDQHLVGEVESVVWGEVPLDGMRTCARVVQASTGSNRPLTLFWRTDDTGLWRFSPNSGASYPDPRDPVQVIPGPVGSETRWERTDLLPPEALVDRDDPPEPRKLESVGEIVAMGETVTVPAGTFTTMHIRGTTTGAIQLVEDMWFAPGIGPIKLVAVGPNLRMEQELLRYTVGMGPTFDHVAVLAAALGDNRDDTVTWLSPSGHVHGRFAVVRPRTGSPSCWFVNERAHCIEVETPAAWQPILMAMRADAPRFSIALTEAQRATDDRRETTNLAATIAEVETARRGLRTGSVLGVVSSDPNNLLDGGSSVTLLATDADDSAYEHTVRVRLDAGVVRAATTTCKPAANDRRRRR